MNRRDAAEVIANVESGIVQIAVLRGLPLTAVWMEWCEQDKHLYLDSSAVTS